MIGTHTVIVGGVDISCLVDSGSIAHGRDDTTGQPEASAVTVDITVGPGTPLPDAVDIGARITIDTALGATVSRRFTGTVTDLSLGWEEAGEDTPDTGTGRIVAVGPLADYGRRVVGAVPFPQELDGARVARIFSLAGLVLDPAYSDPGTVQVIPRDVDARSALEVATDTATSAGGMIWETKAGDIRYADAEHRRNIATTLDLDACDILVTPTWTRNTGGLVNDLTLTYGVQPDGEGDETQPVYQAANAASKARYGRYEYSATVELANLADVTAAANLILVQNARPVWLLERLPVDVAGLTQAETTTLLGLEMHSLIRVNALPTTGPTPVNVVMWIEGWTETFGWGVHDIELWVSDYCRTSPPPRWNDVDPALTWDAAVGTWDDAACMGPPVDYGRWDDTSASTRWNQVPAATTWDTVGAV